MQEVTSGTVLVIDDDASVQLTLSIALREVADRVLIASDIQMGLELIQRAHVDLICVDTNLPGFPSIETIRASDPAIGILVIVGYSPTGSGRATLDLGVDGYIEKPFDVETLLLTAQKTIALCARRRETVRRGGPRRDLHTARVFAPHDILAASIERLLRESALEIANTAEPDLVISALDGPRGTLARVSELRRRFPGAEFVVLSPLYDVSMMISLIELGVAATLGLPLKANELRTQVARLRRGSGPRVEAQRF